MPIRNAQEFTFRPFGLVDAVDATNAQPGGLSSCQNLIPAPNNPGFFVPRPAATKLIDLSSVNATGVVSCMAVVGSYVYGMIQSSTYANKDEPFVYDTINSVLRTVTGVATANLPNTQPTAGAWVPPCVFGAGSRVMFCHPGFPATSGALLGWLDISGFTNTACFGNTTSGSPTLRSLRTNVGNSAPILSGFQPGMTVTGAGIPANTTILSTSNGAFSLATTGNTTSGSAAIASVASVVGVEVGMTLTGPAFPTGTYVTAVASGSITASQNALVTATGSALTVTGGGLVTLSANATATATGVALSVAGGTIAAPQWGSGNLNGNALVTAPICGSLFNGRAWYGSAQYAVFSDPLNPTQVTQASQALTVGDQSPVTAIVSLPLTSQLTGGIQQSLTIYKGAGSFFQVTGDASTGNLAVNAVTGSVGTLAPNSIAQTPLGVAAVSVDGVRFLGLTGTQSDRIGLNGAGVTVPFLNAITPSRICAAYAENVYRVAVTSAVSVSQTPYEYWFDLTTKQWSGPHTFAAALLEAHPAGNGFLAVPIDVPASVWFSDIIPKPSSVYLENAVQLNWTMETTLLPDNEALAYNAVVETAISFSSPQSDPLQITAITESEAYLDSVTLFPDPSVSSAVWGTGIWGGFVWGVPSGTFRRYPISWNQPLVFRQAKLRVSGSSDAGQTVGDIFVRYQLLGYGIDVPR